jgi:hypothetical protein
MFTFAVQVIQFAFCITKSTLYVSWYFSFDKSLEIRHIHHWLLLVFRVSQKVPCMFLGILVLPKV